MPSLLRRFKASTEPANQLETCEEDETKALTRQASLLGSAPSDDGPRQPDASVTRRFSRQLSLPSVPFKRKKSMVPSQYHDQSQCLFFNRLPYELRENVYLAMMRPQDWMIDLRKVSDDPRELKRQQKRRGKSAHEPRSANVHAFFNLMRTCKAIHEEIQTLLFDQSIVRYPSLSTFINFISTTASSHWTELRHLSLNVSFPYILFHEREGGPQEDKLDPSKMQYYSRDTWISACNSILKMQNLRSLSISMYARDYRDLHPHWPSRPSKRLWDAIAEPLLGVECAEFVVDVSWPLDEDADKDDKPFVLRTKAPNETESGHEELEDDATSSASGMIVGDITGYTD